MRSLTLFLIERKRGAGPHVSAVERVRASWQTHIRVFSRRYLPTLPDLRRTLLMRAVKRRSFQ